ncbi:MAG: hypothetical protein HQ475_08355 [SAR202 cluster bacterium]|nr:hypothetical protein [SAR202 cluster bacterium]
MGCIFSIFRAGATLVLGVVVFVGFLFFLILNNFSDKLLNADFYKDTITGQDTYNRIYDDVLVDDELLDRTAELLGDIKIVTHQEIVDLTRQIIPPAYIQAQVEGTINRTIAYVNDDVETLNAYIDLSEPLKNVKPIMFAYIDGRIDELEEEDPGTTTCTINGVTVLATSYVDKFSGIANGEVPTSVPSLKALDPLCRQILFASSFDLLLASSTLSAETTQQFADSRDEMRGPFEAGDTIAMLKIAARALAGPLMDDAIDRVRENLSAGDRFDLIQQIAKWNPNTSEAQIRSDLDEGRGWLTKARAFGELTTLIMVIGGSVLIGLVYLPSLAGMLRYPGIVLLFTGVVFFVIGKIAESEVPDRLTSLIETGADKASDIPPSVTDLGGDIMISFGSQLTNGFAGPSLSLLIIGAILFGASFFVFPIKRFIPFVK